ncbi:hypothetical protein J3R82DRAFT_8056 [Butyriboletus roseoflavus]|nr:hypothetical protein J3R82DRAFT_8056 [Butyriboletus roseoflavus]
MYRHGDYSTTSNTEDESAVLHGFGDMLEGGGIVPEFNAKTTFRPSPPPPPPGSADEGQVHAYTPYVAPVTERFETLPVLHSILEEMVALGRAMGWPDEEGGRGNDLAYGCSAYQSRGEPPS